MRIVVDAMGGDCGPDTVVHGVKLALASGLPITELLLVGDQAQLDAALAKVRLSDGRIRPIHASQVLTMEDKPIEGLRRKKDCSILRAVDLLKEGRGDALISTGNTGGIVAASTIRLRTLEGVERAALATVMPSETGHWVLVDVGATPECKPIQLAQFAIMGRLYCQKILGTPNPRVGILSNGTEEIKGTELTREAHQLCRQLDVNYIGYVESFGMFTGAVDVVVTDGFLGNIVLKSAESLAKVTGRILKRELMANPLRQLGAFLAKGAFGALRQRLDPDAYGGAPLLGLNGNVIKAHGSANAHAIGNAIRVATETIQHQLNRSIIEAIAQAERLLATPAP